MRIDGKRVLMAGLAGGTLDLAFALLYAGSKGTAPGTLLQVVASGLFGQHAFEMGATSMVVGAAAHVALSVAWAALFAVLFARRRVCPWLTGLLFGAGVLLVMRLVVLPLSAYPFPVKFATEATLYDLLSHMFLFGLPISLTLLGWRPRYGPLRNMGRRCP